MLGSVNFSVALKLALPKSLCEQERQKSFSDSLRQQ